MNKTIATACVGLTLAAAASPAFARVRHHRQADPAPAAESRINSGWVRRGAGDQPSRRRGLSPASPSNKPRNRIHAYETNLRRARDVVARSDGKCRPSPFARRRVVGANQLSGLRSAVDLRLHQGSRDQPLQRLELMDRRSCVHDDHLLAANKWSRGKEYPTPTIQFGALGSRPKATWKLPSSSGAAAISSPEVTFRRMTVMGQKAEILVLSI
jgi:hypothetical protein